MTKSSSTAPAANEYRQRSRNLRTTTKWMFYAHLWLGVTVAFLVVIIAVTGILLNHKRTLSLMPEADFAQPESFEIALPLPVLAQVAMQEVSPEIAGAGIDRMDVRPGKGLIKVRFRDDRVTEVILALHDGTLLSTGARSDTFIEQLHSGHVFGDAGFLLSDLAAGALILILISGFWMWLYPHSKAR